MRAKDPGADGRRTCVICGRPQDPRHRPFCSERCRMVDLGRWLQGAYRLPGTEPLSPEAVADEGGDDDGPEPA
ncbi:MAG: hypothetical protein KatS3mg119_1152 [Rhodothalassiaceae bacterium]|nr:MAG: hypothetical protein KatS3mg119_1152 [Rhodothalassiaceae bacterium]